MSEEIDDLVVGAAETPDDHRYPPAYSIYPQFKEIHVSYLGIFDSLGNGPFDPDEQWAQRILELARKIDKDYEFNNVILVTAVVRGCDCKKEAP